MDVYYAKWPMGKRMKNEDLGGGKREKIRYGTKGLKMVSFWVINYTFFRGGGGSPKNWCGPRVLEARTRGDCMDPSNYRPITRVN